MTEQEAVAYIEEWDVTEAAKVLKWYEEDELLRPCDCDTIVAIETEDIRAENDKLKTDVERMFQANVEKNNEILGLLKDNAKLRELVRHLYTCMINIDMDGNYECFSCEYENTDGLCDYERLMRELGIEV